jgi:exodeoxyribonuclease VII small subunit
MANNITFEKALEQLEDIVDVLESEELSLEKALEKFEEGMKLSQYCSNKLDETEKKISLILERSNDDFEEVSFINTDTS